MHLDWGPFYIAGLLVGAILGVRDFLRANKK